MACVHTVHAGTKLRPRTKVGKKPSGSSHFGSSHFGSSILAQGFGLSGRGRVASHMQRVNMSIGQVTLSAVLDRELLLLRVADLVSAGGSVAPERPPPEPEPPRPRPPSLPPRPERPRATKPKAQPKPPPKPGNKRSQRRGGLESERQKPHVSVAPACARPLPLGLAARCWSPRVFAIATARRCLGGHLLQFHLRWSCSRALRSQVPLLVPGPEHNWYSRGPREAAALCLFSPLRLLVSSCANRFAGGGPSAFCICWACAKPLPVFFFSTKVPRLLLCRPLCWRWLLCPPCACCHFSLSTCTPPASLVPGPSLR